MAKLQVELDEERLRRMVHNAGNLRNDRPPPNADLTVEAAGLVELGWLAHRAAALRAADEVVEAGGCDRLERFGAFVAHTLAAAYFPPEIVRQEHAAVEGQDEALSR